MPSNNVTKDIADLETKMIGQAHAIANLQSEVDRWRGTDGPAAHKTRQQEHADQQLRLQCVATLNGRDADENLIAEADRLYRFVTGQGEQAKARPSSAGPAARLAEAAKMAATASKVGVSSTTYVDDDGYIHLKGECTAAPRELKVSRSTLYTSKSDCEKDAKAQAEISRAFGYVVEAALNPSYNVNQLAQLGAYGGQQHQPTMWQYLIVH